MLSKHSANVSEVAQSFQELLSPAEAANSPANISQRLSALRKLVLLEGIPRSPTESAQIRPLVWKLFLDLHLPQSPLATSEASSNRPKKITAEEYVDLTTRDSSSFYAKIKNDAFRTLATDQTFIDKVGEEKLIRFLEAFVHQQLDASNTMSEQATRSSTPYVQGMNVLAAPFLYVLPSQLEAFSCFVAFIEIQAPRYVRPTLEGVHAGSRLVDACLAHIDPVLFAHLAEHQLAAQLYAFPSLLTFCAGTPPLEEVIELWDFLLAYGFGLNVLCIVAQLWRMRDSLLISTSPMKLLRTFPKLNSREIIPLAVGFIGELPDELYSSVVRHPWDDTAS